MGNNKTNLTITVNEEELSLNGVCSPRDLLNVMNICLMELDKLGVGDKVLQNLMANRTKEENTNE